MIQASEAAIGTTLDSRYRLTQVLRVGTTATTYAATRISDGAPLVVKVLSTVDPTADELQRLRTEAAIGARTGHRAIATPIAVRQTQDGAPFLVYELPPGEELTARLKRGRLPLDAALAIARQAGEAVHAAHEAGVVHGDLRPASLYVDGDGAQASALVIDFGIARLRETRVRPSASESSNTPAIVGAVSYMAPEQAHGRPADARADQFALAAVAFEMVTGKGPFGVGPSLAILSRVLHAEPPPMVGVSREVERVILRALAKRPEDRFPSVGEFVAALVKAGGRPSLPRGVSGEGPAVADEKREPWQIATRPVIKVDGPPPPLDALDEEAPPRRRRGALWLLGGCVLAAALGLGVLLGRRLSGEAKLVVKELPVVEAKPPSPSLPPRDPNGVKLELVLDPPDARVRIGDQLVTSPSLTLPRSSTPVTLSVDAPDHLPTTREVIPDGDQRLVIRLTSTAAPSLPSRAPRPKAEAPKAKPSPQRTLGDLRDPFSE